MNFKNILKKKIQVLWRGKRIIKRQTIIDCHSVDEIVSLVKLVSSHGGTDELVERLERLFITFPPDDSTLQRVSIFQQQTQGLGNELEFCCTMLHVVLLNHVVNHQMRTMPTRCITDTF
jgi:hypothetical protein